MLKKFFATGLVVVVTMVLAYYPAELLVRWLEGQWCMPIHDEYRMAIVVMFDTLICATTASYLLYFYFDQKKKANSVADTIDGKAELVDAYALYGWRFQIRIALAVVWMLLLVSLMFWKDLELQKCDFSLPNIIGVAEAAESADNCRRGYDYLVNLTSTAAADLRAKGVHSVTYPSELVVDVVGQRAVIAPFVLENLSRDEFKAAKDKKAKAKLVCAVLSEYGQKGSRAFQGRSNGPYYGPAQMSGGMYNVVRSIYSAGLIADSGRGRDNHLNLAKAVYLHHDATFKDLSTAARNKVGTGEWRNRAMIGTHNLEASQVSKAIIDHDKNWRFSSYKVVVKTKSGKKVTKTRYNPISPKMVVYLSMYVDGVYEVFDTFGRSNS